MNRLIAGVGAILLPSRLAMLCLLTLVLSGCSIGYYWQASAGQMRIVNGKESVASLLGRDDLEPAERQRLELSQEALSFAHDAMLLPDNGSYRSYYDTAQSYVVWNVFAAPEFSLQPLVWCFPVAGCIAYRGYFTQASASKYASKLAAAGDDVFVGGVTAYSTLGKFRDPLLNTMLDLSEPEFVGLLFHELAHQRLYVKNDSAFNEGFASAVEQEGVRRWQATKGLLSADQRDAQEQIAAVVALLRAAREQLKQLYASELDPAAMRVAKAQRLAELTVAYEDLAVSWQQAGLAARPYGRMFAEGWNNASLSAVATYDDYVPAFANLLQQCGGELACFYQRAEKISQLEADQRAARLLALMPTVAGAK